MREEAEVSIAARWHRPHATPALPIGVASWGALGVLAFSVSLPMPPRSPSRDLDPGVRVDRRAVIGCGAGGRSCCWRRARRRGRAATQVRGLAGRRGRRRVRLPAAHRLRAASRAVVARLRRDRVPARRHGRARRPPQPASARARCSGWRPCSARRSSSGSRCATAPAAFELADLMLLGAVLSAAIGLRRRRPAGGDDGRRPGDLLGRRARRFR